MSDYLTDRELAELLDIPTRTPGQWRYLRRGPAYMKVGRHVRYRREDVEGWLAEQTVTPAHGGGDHAA